LSPALADQLVAHPVHHQGRLLRLGRPRNEPHAWPRYRFAAALGGGGVVLVGLAVGLHVLRRHRPHLVAQPGQLARPKMRAAAGLHADQAARQVGEERQHLGPRQPLPQHHPAALIDALHLEHVLRDVETVVICIGRLPRSWLLTASTLAHPVPREASISLCDRAKPCRRLAQRRTDSQDRMDHPTPH